MSGTRDIVKTVIACTAASVLLAACSGGADLAPKTTQETSAAERLHSDTLPPSGMCTPVFSCARVTIVAPVRGANNGMGLLLFSKTAVPASWSVTRRREFAITRQTMASGTLCANDCSLVVSSVPLPDGPAIVSVVEASLSQLTPTEISLSTQSTSWPPGTYYFYFAKW